MNLLEMTGETGQYLQDYRDLSVVDNPIDYQHVHQVFEIKRGEARSFLVQALES